MDDSPSGIQTAPPRSRQTMPSRSVNSISRTLEEREELELLVLEDELEELL